MKLQTQIPLQQVKHNLIDYKSNIFLLGSCFSENIGKKLDYFKFQNLQNPFGILFHPKAIETLIENAINQKEYSEDDIFFHNEQWHCFDAHSKLSHISKQHLLNKLNSNMESTTQQLKNSSHIMITLGTAWVYHFIETNSQVANCHKLPQKEFLKEILSVEEIVASFKNMVTLIRTINTKASIIFTVSPIRHLKDGFIENTRSKAHLIAAIHDFLNQKSPIVNCESFYFPSYEILMDELRDYRFYSEDMIHPNQVAIQYIWDKFQSVWVSGEALSTMEEVDSIQKGYKHKPFYSNSEAHQLFIKKLEERKRNLLVKFPSITF